MSCSPASGRTSSSGVTGQPALVDPAGAQGRLPARRLPQPPGRRVRRADDERQTPGAVVGGQGQHGVRRVVRQRPARTRRRSVGGPVVPRVVGEADRRPVFDRCEPERSQPTRHRGAVTGRVDHQVGLEHRVLGPDAADPPVAVRPGRRHQSDHPHAAAYGQTRLRGGHRRQGRLDHRSAPGHGVELLVTVLVAAGGGGGMQVQLVDRPTTQGEQGVADVGQLVLHHLVPTGQRDVHLPELVHSGPAPVAPRLVGGGPRLGGVTVQHHDGVAGPGQQQGGGQTGGSGAEHHHLANGSSIETSGAAVELAHGASFVASPCSCDRLLTYQVTRCSLPARSCSLRGCCNTRKTVGQVRRGPSGSSSIAHSTSTRRSVARARWRR